MSLKTFRDYITNTFNTPNWTDKQHDLYKMMQQFVINYNDANMKYETKDDKLMIRNNFAEQAWFKFSKSKPILGLLLDGMTVKNYSYDNNIQSINLNITLAFNSFKVECSMYKNNIDNFMDYYICFKKQHHPDAFMCCYRDNFTEILPEFVKIYKIIGMDDSILSRCDLVNFFTEIILYYDPSETVGLINIGKNININLNQLVQSLNVNILREQRNLPK